MYSFQSAQLKAKNKYFLFRYAFTSDHLLFDRDFDFDR